MTVVYDVVSVRDAIEDALSTEYGTFIDATTPGRLAHSIAEHVAAALADANMAPEERWAEAETSRGQVRVPAGRTYYTQGGAS